MFGIGKDKGKDQDKPTENPGTAPILVAPSNGEFDPSPEAIMAETSEVLGEGQAVSSGATASAAAASVAPHASVAPAHPERTLIELESQSDGMNRFPHLDAPHTRSARTETQINRILDAVTSLYMERADGVDETAMGLDFASLPAVPKGFGASWSTAIRRQIWGGQSRVSRGLFSIYSSALENSHQVRAFSESPLIRETGIQEARGQFDIIFVH